jgi:hypothetical protein
MREKTFPAGAVADRQGFPLPPPQPNTDCYVSIRWNNRVWQLRRGENGRQQLERADKLQGSAPFHCADQKHFFEMKLWATPRIIRRVTVYIITHSGHLLMFLFHGGRARPKKKRELTQRVAELCFPLSHSLTHSISLVNIDPALTKLMNK